MLPLTRLFTLLFVVAFVSPLASGQVVRDSSGRRPAADSLSRRTDSTKSFIMTVDSTIDKQGTAATQPPEAKKPRSSTLRTVERQTAPHAAKNVPHVKNTKPTNR
jgi:hypothetical protein